MTEQELKIKYDHWFTENWDYYCNEVRNNIANGQMSRYAHDLCVLMYEELMNKSHEYKLNLYQNDKIMNWLLFSSSFQIKSGSSPFYRIFRKPTANNVPNYIAENEGLGGTTEKGWDNDEAWLCVEKALSEDGVNWYSSKLLQMKYIQNMTFTDMVNQYGFALNTLKKDLKKAEDEVLEFCKHLNK